MLSFMRDFEKTKYSINDDTITIGKNSYNKANIQAILPFVEKPFSTVMPYVTVVLKDDSYIHLYFSGNSAAWDSYKDISAWFQSLEMYEVSHLSKGPK